MMRNVVKSSATTRPAILVLASLVPLFASTQPASQSVASHPLQSACEVLISAPAVSTSTGGPAHSFHATSSPSAGWGVIAHVVDSSGDLSAAPLWDSREKEIRPDSRPVASVNDARAGDAQRTDHPRQGTASSVPPADNSQRRDRTLSTPFFVGAPPPSRFGLIPEGASYDKFAEATATRTPVVYASDERGWLLGLDAETGERVLQFVPARASEQESVPAAAAANHLLSAGEAFVHGSWRTVLLGAFGSEIYALDVTRPVEVDDSGRPSRQMLLWEFSENDAAGPGPTYTQPVVARLRDGTWAAIFAGAYNNADDSAALYILDIASGRLAKKIAARTNEEVRWKNSLSAPAIVDVDGDGAVDYAYAGDLHGDLWKFDLTANVASGWGVALAGEPLFRARDASGKAQPVFTRPEVIRGPQGVGVTVLFGAGPNSALASIADDVGSSFYAVSDRHQQTQSRSKLLARRFTTVGSFRYIDAVESSNTNGWYLDLPSKPEASEQLISHPVVRYSRVIFRTQLSGASACRPAETWTMAVTAQASGNGTGGSPSIPEQSDTRGPSALPLAGTASTAYAGYALSYPIAFESRTATGRCVEAIYFANGVQIESARIPFCDPRSTGRQSWRQLH